MRAIVLPHVQNGGSHHIKYLLHWSYCAGNHKVNRAWGELNTNTGGDKNSLEGGARRRKPWLGEPDGLPASTERPPAGGRSRRCRAGPLRTACEPGTLALCVARYAGAASAWVRSCHPGRCVEVRCQHAAQKHLGKAVSAKPWLLSGR